MRASYAGRRSRLALLVAFLAMVLGMLLPLGTASASGLPAAETRVEVSPLAAPDVVGIHECIAAGQHVDRAPSQLRHAVGHCVAANTGRTAARSCLRSFAGTTLILMADGTKKPIEEIEVGDEVVATDPETGERVTHRVTRVWVHDDDVLDLVVDGEVITTTEDHLFWSVTDQRFECADELTAGEVVLGDGGRQITVSGFRLGTERSALVYNLSIAGVHTYHVGSEAILVHNDCSDAAYQGMLHIREEIARQGSRGSHSWAAKMTDDELAGYLDGFVVRGGGQPLKGGGVGWYDPDRGIGIIQRSEYSMTGYSMPYESFLGKLR